MAIEILFSNDKQILSFNGFDADTEINPNIFKQAMQCWPETSHFFVDNKIKKNHYHMKQEYT